MAALRVRAACLLPLAGIVIQAVALGTQERSHDFPQARTAYALTLTPGGTEVVERDHGARQLVPYGERMTFAGAAKYSKPTAAMLRGIRSHLEGYVGWRELVDLPVDFLRTGVAWPTGPGRWGQLEPNPPKLPDRADKVVVGYVNSFGFSAIGQHHPAFRPSWDKNGDAIIDSDVTDLPEYVDLKVFDPAWKGYGAAYWTASWRQELQRQIDYAAAQHFDGIMLDVMTGYNIWNRVYPSLDRRDLQERMADLYRWISGYAKGMYGNAFVVTANLDPNAKDYFQDLGEVLDAGYYQNALFDWTGSGVVNGPGRSTRMDRYTNPIASFTHAQGLSLLDLDHLGTGQMTPGLDFTNYDDRITIENLQTLFRWAIESGFTPFCSPVSLRTPFALTPRFVRMIPGRASAANSVYADWVIGSDDAEQIATGDGDDVVYGGPGNDVIDGGSGSNTAFYTGVHGNFRIEVTDGRLYVEDRVGSEGVDTLVNVQFLQFADGGTGVDAVVQRAKERSARSQ